MPRITDIDPMLNMYRESKDYLKPFYGVRIFYSNGDNIRVSYDDALCFHLTKKQRKYVEHLKQEAYKRDEIVLI